MLALTHSCGTMRLMAAGRDSDGDGDRDGDG